jgi:nucleoside-diphosphate-sugar epimerase
MTRSPAKVDRLGELGAEPVLCDVYDLDALRDAIGAFGPEVVMHQLTDMPDDRASIPEFAEANRRIYREGTRNLLDAGRKRARGG